MAGSVQVGGDSKEVLSGKALHRKKQQHAKRLRLRERKRKLNCVGGEPQRKANNTISDIDECADLQDVKIMKLVMNNKVLHGDQPLCSPEQPEYMMQEEEKELHKLTFGEGVNSTSADLQTDIQLHESMDVLRTNIHNDNDLTGLQLENKRNMDGDIDFLVEPLTSNTADEKSAAHSKRKNEPLNTPIPLQDINHTILPTELQNEGPSGSGLHICKAQKYDNKVKAVRDFWTKHYSVNNVEVAEYISLDAVFGLYVSLNPISEVNQHQFFSISTGEVFVMAKEEHEMGSFFLAVPKSHTARKRHKVSNKVEAGTQETAKDFSSISQSEPTENLSILPAVEKFLSNVSVDEAPSLNKLYSLYCKDHSGSFKQFVKATQKVSSNLGITIIRDKKRHCQYLKVDDKNSTQHKQLNVQTNTIANGKGRLRPNQQSINNRQQLDKFFKEHYETSEGNGTSQSEVYLFYLSCSKGRKRHYNQFLEDVLAIPRIKSTKEKSNKMTILNVIPPTTKSREFHQRHQTRMSQQFTIDNPMFVKAEEKSVHV